MMKWLPSYGRLWRSWLILLTVSTLLGVGRTAHAQVSAYAFSAVAGTFVPLPTTATAVPTILADDVPSGILPLGFAFVFDGTSYTDVKASSNGFLSFNPAAGGNLSNNLSGPTAATNEKPLIAALWDDLYGRPAVATASYLTTGTAPNRVFTMEWLNWSWYYTSTVANLSFQIKLYEGSNRIELAYRQEANAPTGGLSASIGLASGTGGAGCPGEYLSLSDASAAPTASSTVETNTINVRPATGQVYRFSPPTTTGCPAPRCVAITNITGTSAQLTFRGNSNATSYTVTYLAQGSTTPVTVTPPPTAAPVPLTGLSISTTYTATVTANCAGGGTSVPTSVTFTTSNGYCLGTTSATGTAQPLGGSCGGNNISDVAVVGTTLNATGLTCTTGTPGAYTNYPATPPTTGTLLRGVSYPVTVTTDGNSIISVWIDYNHDLDFSASEWVQVATTTTPGSPNSATVQVPLTAPLGTTGMRVRSRVSGSPNGATDPCTQFYSGETKDFTVTIGPAPACPPPSALSASNLTTTGATLNFTTAGGGTYALVYGPSGFNPATSGTTVNPATSPVPVTGLLPGTTYQFYVQQNCGAAGLSQNSGPVNFTTLIVNDDPCGATPLPVNNTCTPLATTTTGATTTAPLGYTNPTSSCGSNANPRDVWFTFTTAATGPISTAVRLSVTGNAASLVQVFSSASCRGPFTSMGCAGTTANAAAPNLDLTTLTPSTTYYVRVAGYSAASSLGNFTICASPVPNCPLPTVPAALNVTKNSALLTWAAGTGTIPAGSTYTVVYGPPGFNPNNPGPGVITQAGITGTSVQLTGLASNTDFAFFVRLICGGFNGNSTFVGPETFRTLLESPSNDEPCGADPLTTSAVAGSTVGATTSLQNGITLPACSPARAPRDVWYTFNGPAAPNNAMRLTLTGTATGMVRVYTAADCAAGPFVDVFCQAAAGANQGFTGPVTVPGLVSGQRYYVAVSGYGSSDAPAGFTVAAQPTFVTATANSRAAAALSVFPNPSNTGQLTVRLAGATATTGQLVLRNALGQLVLNQAVTLHNGLLDHTLDTHTLPAGFYTITLQAGNQTLTRKVGLE